MRIVVKIGTSLLCDAKGFLDKNFLQTVVLQIAQLHNAGHQVIIVSSGAVASGRSKVNFAHEKKNIPYRQALAAVGQGVLIETYGELFKAYDIPVAQALLTNYDFVNRENFLNTKNVFEVLLEKGVIPVVNENDVTTIAELKFGDNDMLCAKTAAMVSADYLFVLTDVDGLFAEDPKKNPRAALIPVVPEVTNEIRALAGGARSAGSMGGMITKLEAADYVTSVGIPMFIVNGRRKGIITELRTVCEQKPFDEEMVIQKNIGTFFASSVSKLASTKKWLRPKIQKNAWVEVDDGATKALTGMGKSLLPSGVVKVHGEFKRGDVILIKSGTQQVGYGQVNYDSVDVDKLKKHHSKDIEKLLGFSFEDELIHRDRMVVE